MEVYIFSLTFPIGGEVKLVSAQTLQKYEDQLLQLHHPALTHSLQLFIVTSTPLISRSLKE